MTEEDYPSDYRLGYKSGLIIGAAAAFGVYQILKLGVDWTKAGIQELKDRRDLNLRK